MTAPSSMSCQMKPNPQIAMCPIDGVRRIPRSSGGKSGSSGIKLLNLTLVTRILRRKERTALLNTVALRLHGWPGRMYRGFKRFQGLRF